MNGYSELKNKNNLNKIMYNFYFLFLFTILYFIFITKFISGNYTAADRFFYLLFATEPSESRFEPLYVLLGNLLTIFESPEFSLNILASLVFLFTYVVLKKYIEGLYWFTISFIIIFMAVFVIFSIIQIRAGLCLWICLLLFYYIHEKKSNIGLMLLGLTPLIHSMSLFFVIVVYLIYIFKFNLIHLHFMIFFGLLLTILNLNILLNLLPLQIDVNYYLQYFNGLTTDVYKSPFVLIYLFITGFLILYRKNPIIKEYKILWFGTNLTIIAILTNLDILIKIASPFILLSWIIFFKVFSITRNKEHNIIFRLFFLLFITPSFVYFYLRY